LISLQHVVQSGGEQKSCPTFLMSAVVLQCSKCALQLLRFCINHSECIGGRNEKLNNNYSVSVWIKSGVLFKVLRLNN